MNKQSSHNFKRVGTFTVTQTVEDKNGKQESSATASIEVKGPTRSDLNGTSWEDVQTKDTWVFDLDSVTIGDIFKGTFSFGYSVDEEDGTLKILNSFTYLNDYIITRYYNDKMHLLEVDGDTFIEELELERY
ncbi:MAG: hypothetical protein IH946_04025 [Bacteroidetes bacterium]|nr:hypothetical protein [Bacteroidota bacterium]